MATCRLKGLIPFANFSLIHVVPPCHISDADAQIGPNIIDEVLLLADEAIA
ncbi:hypothetical protein [Arthrobacter sp. StoSoilA2]|uniref:hypothetical protein n=1 Tax=Arthrobacter sp. StoSoilA2 TaxID=2830990 RepID=UPI001CC6DDAB|nr:hypothetical protein [Arthrobacter sp. StoSoilA2]